MVPVGSSGSTHETLSVLSDFVSAAKFRTTDVCMFVRVCVCVRVRVKSIYYCIYSNNSRYLHSGKVICLVLQPI